MAVGALICIVPTACWIPTFCLPEPAISLMAFTPFRIDPTIPEISAICLWQAEISVQQNSECVVPELLVVAPSAVKQSVLPLHCAPNTGACLAN